MTMRVCPFCRYDLTGLDEPGKCPECGNRVDAAFLDTIMRHPQLDARLLMWRFAGIGWIIAVLLLLFSGAIAGGVVGLGAVAMCIGMVAACLVMNWRTPRLWPREYIQNPEAPESALVHTVAFVVLLFIWIPLFLLFVVVLFSLL